MVLKLLNYRRGNDDEEFTSDDRFIDIGSIGLNAKEKVLFSAISQYRTKKSDYLNIQVEAVEKNRGIASDIEAIVRRDDLRVVYWHRN